MDGGEWEMLFGRAKGLVWGWFLGGVVGEAGTKEEQRCPRPKPRGVPGVVTILKTRSPNGQVGSCSATMKTPAGATPQQLGGAISRQVQIQVRVRVQVQVRMQASTATGRTQDAGQQTRRRWWKGWACLAGKRKADCWTPVGPYSAGKRQL
ncbi:hypothetical protein F4803DRAFT_371462 [Xylaria telfairii]|nr:hypothetical protein F4803DRAFT_371462 [Xylaria telfairii]